MFQIRLSLQVKIKHLAGLVVVQLIAGLSLIAFNQLQPVLLEVFELSQIRFQLTAIQNLSALLVIIPAGLLMDKYFSDKYFMGIDTSVLIIILSLGLLLLTLYGWLGNGSLIWIPLSGWFIAVKLFSVSGYSLVDRYVSHDRIPIASAFIAQAVFLTFLFSSYLNELFYLTGPTKMTIGLLLLTAFGFLLFRLVDNGYRNDFVQSMPPVTKTRFISILVVGLLIGFFQISITSFLPIWVMAKSKNNLSWISSDFLLMVLLGVAFISALPLAQLPVNRDVRKNVLMAVAGNFISLTFIFVVPDLYAALVGVIISGVSFAWLFVSGIPFVISRSTPPARFLCFAIFFSSIELPGLMIDLLRFGK